MSEETTVGGKISNISQGTFHIPKFLVWICIKPQLHQLPGIYFAKIVLGKVNFCIIPRIWRVYEAQ